MWSAARVPLGAFSSALILIGAVSGPARAESAPPPAQVSKSGGNIEIVVHGFVQLDGRAFLGGGHASDPDTFCLRRARPIVDATLFGWIDFRIAPDFSNGKVELFDAYLEARFSPRFRVRAGKFKAPVGLERLQSGSDIRFVERALPTLVAPNRDVGVVIFGDMRGGHVSCAASVMNGVADGTSADTDIDNGKDLSGRILLQPWTGAHARRHGTLAFGVAGTWGRARGTPASPGLAAYVTSGRRTFFRFRTGTSLDTAVVANGTRARITPHATYYVGPLGLMAEFIRSSQDISRGSARLRSHTTAWQLAGTWLVTGETASYRGVTPNRPLVPRSGQWGAVEVAVRYTALHVDSAVFPIFADPDVAARAVSAWAAGVNWYWNPSIKVAVDYERTTFEPQAPGSDGFREQVLLARMQIWF
jgi:phosphate-selective porin OprO/OprP